ncbi:FUSC family protein [Antarcticibacterium sp. 1MA-6-2]|uniref:FUSC family protein n=1 Tax=Antarcticibacterium sp. 1MA-6-2 TaxID=2908210 RepID=UPI001F26B190|nr:FUSC family membrane protein [Antarcticibacterium sp. 1MA-6-2]UJH91764.1 FUSC family protein [Antarcticibacterium sp. 1MA-6-2]
MNLSFSHIIPALSKFFKSTDFVKGCILGTAITLPIAVGVQLEKFEIGLAISLGALLSSPSDVSGSQRHKNYGIFLSAIWAVVGSLAGGYFIKDSLYGLPILGLVTFCLSYVSVFGFRASFISFSGLFALVLSFANISNVLEIYERALIIGAGGLWYLCLSNLWHWFYPKAHTDENLADTFDLTAQYLQVRGKLISQKEDRSDNILRLLELQTSINEKHEVLRNILISSRTTSGNSNFERKRLLVLIQLIDILEQAMSHPVHYETMDKLREKYPGLIEKFEHLNLKMAESLRSLGASISTIHNLIKFNLNLRLKDINQAILSTLQGDEEDYVILQNLHDYQEKQVHKISEIERLLQNPDLRKIKFMRKDEAVKFITPQEYDPNLLLENFSFKSSVFKHSLRIAIVVMVGFIVGAYFALQNSYWILLTIIVIMRPTYGLTKTRFRERTIGTLIGAVIATGIVLLTHNLILYAILGILSLILAFAMLQKNYRASAVFITLSIVFVYALLEPNVINVIKFRVIDTIIGAGLAALGNTFLWPSWEIYGIKSVIADSVAANREYFKEVIKYYQEKGKIRTSYKLSRKQAFLKMGDLSAAFQRMTQEPKRKQHNLDKFYELTALNHNFLSSLASMGTYIQNHTTTEASGQLLNYAAGIGKHLENSLAVLNSQNNFSQQKVEKQEEAEEYFRQNYKSLQINDRNSGISTGPFHEKITGSPINL